MKRVNMPRNMLSLVQDALFKGDVPWHVALVTLSRSCMALYCKPYFELTAYALFGTLQLFKEWPFQMLLSSWGQ